MVQSKFKVQLRKRRRRKRSSIRLQYQSRHKKTIFDAKKKSKFTLGIKYTIKSKDKNNIEMENIGL